MPRVRYLSWRVNTAGLFKEIISNPNTSILTRPLQITGKILAAVAERATQLDDAELDGLMCSLALYSVSDPDDKENYNERVTARTIRRGENARRKRLKEKTDGMD